jgi:hypothetical protein
MDTLLTALRSRDTSLLLSCFSRRRRFYVTSTEGAKSERTPFGYESLAKGLEPGGDFVDLIYGNDGLDSLAALAWDDKAPNRWVSVSATRFAPWSLAPAAGEAPMFFVSWVAEGKHFVVEEIATPF